MSDNAVSLQCLYSPEPDFGTGHLDCAKSDCGCDCHKPNDDDGRAGWLEELFMNHDLTLIGHCSAEGFCNHKSCGVSEYLPAFLGVGTRINLEVAVYDSGKVIDILYEDMKGSELAEDDQDAYTMAVEHFDFNIAGSWVGETSPIFVDTGRWY